MRRPLRLVCAALLLAPGSPLRRGCGPRADSPCATGRGCGGEPWGGGPRGTMHDDGGAGGRSAGAQSDELMTSCSYSEASSASSARSRNVVPLRPLNIAMLVVGTQGDVVPFIAVGLALQRDGHRVRIASHAPLRPLVERYGLEFFPLGGDPQKLAHFAVHNKGVFPRSMGEVQGLRVQIREYVRSQYAACTQPDPAIAHALPFQAEAILANPICYAHMHVADALGVPLHILFTMPWTATSEFAQPQARFLHEKRSAPSRSQWRRWRWLFGAANRASFAAIDAAMFVVTADILDGFRKHELGAPSLYTLRAYHRPATATAGVPASYCWSPNLLPAPRDWPSSASVVGFCQLEAEQGAEPYEPPVALADFLAAGPPPLYIGFGSMMLEDPRAVTETVFAAIEELGMRAIVAKGWGGLGAVKGLDVPKNVLVVDHTPHAWLFPRCAAVVHHGGAGTIAAGLAAGRPSFAVPFFGDQPFWGNMCARAGAGPVPIAVEKLTSAGLVSAVRHLMRPQVQAAAASMAQRMQAEPDGARAAVESFYRHLPAAYRKGYQPPDAMPDRPPLGALEAGMTQQRQSNADTAGRAAASDSTSFADVGAPARPHAVEAERPAGDANAQELPPHMTIDIGSLDARPHAHCNGAAPSLAGSPPGPVGLLPRPGSAASGVALLRGQAGATPPRCRYFEQKRLPALTWWCEAAGAAATVLLLPLLALVPCGTSEARDLLAEEEGIDPAAADSTASRPQA